jgi:sugar phosphate permease
LGFHPLRYVILAVEAAVLVYFTVAVGWATVFGILLAVILGGSVYLVTVLRRRDEEESRHLQSVDREGP